MSVSNPIYRQTAEVYIQIDLSRTLSRISHSMHVRPLGQFALSCIPSSLADPARGLANRIAALNTTRRALGEARMPLANQHPRALMPRPSRPLSYSS